MFLPLSSLILLLLGHALAWWLWRRFVPVEVAKNDADITADGANDSLRKGYHQRRTWVRFWRWLALSAGASLPALLSNYWSFGLSLLAIGLGLAAYFGRYFTPLLNLARAASGRPDITEWYASPDSASWPDAAAWKFARSASASTHDVADGHMRWILLGVWGFGRLGYALLLAGAGALLFLK